MEDHRGRLNGSASELENVVIMFFMLAISGSGHFRLMWFDKSGPPACRLV